MGSTLDEGESGPLSDDYSCKHFTTKWKDSIGPQTKGLAGELQLYEALRIVAKMRNQAAPVLIGEPDDPEMIARKDSFPDCYGFNSLWEARNLCFDRNANPKDPAQLFFRVPLERHGRMMGVKDVTDGKKWDEPRYPIRGSRRHTVVDGNDVYDYSYVMIKQNARRFYVSTVYSYTQDAQFELHRFFGDNMVFVDHPILSDEMCTDDEDRACKQEAFGNLLLLLSEKLRV